MLGCVDESVCLCFCECVCVFGNGNVSVCLSVLKYAWVHVCREMVEFCARGDGS